MSVFISGWHIPRCKTKSFSFFNSWPLTCRRLFPYPLRAPECSIRLSNFLTPTSSCYCHVHLFRPVLQPWTWVRRKRLLWCTGRGAAATGPAAGPACRSSSTSSRPPKQSRASASLAGRSQLRTCASRRPKNAVRCSVAFDTQGAGVVLSLCSTFFYSPDLSSGSEKANILLRGSM